MVEAFDRGRRTAEDLKDWRSLERFVIVREAAPEWEDAFHQLAKLRVQDRKLVFAGIRVTSQAGYLVFTGPEGMQAYCLAIERSGDNVIMPPRLVDSPLSIVATRALVAPRARTRCQTS